MSITGSDSEQARRRKLPRAALGCFFSVFLLMGLGFFIGFFVIPVIGIVRARGWKEVPCVVTRSEVGVHSGDDSDTYSVDVAYEYFVDDTKYVSERYQFFSGSSSGYDGKKEVVDRLRPGTRIVCYIDPRNPSDAVLERGFSAVYLFGLIPLIFVGVGAGGLVFALRRRSPQAETSPTAKSPLPPSEPRRTTLKASMSPMGKLLLAIGIACFWNGILSIFLVMVVGGFRKGDPEWFLTIFLIPFVLVGLGLIVWIFYQLLALFNPRPVLTVSSSPVALDEGFEVEWATTGNVQRVRSFKITLEGREEATYRRGTTTSTDKQTFAVLDVAKGSNGKEFRRGKGRIVFPVPTMHTFKSANNKIVWAIHVKGDIPFWPDVSEEFEIEVTPARGGGRT